jgi:hypothetical protein
LHKIPHENVGIGLKGKRTTCCRSCQGSQLGLAIYIYITRSKSPSPIL